MKGNLHQQRDSAAIESLFPVASSSTDRELSRGHLHHVAPPDIRGSESEKGACSGRGLSAARPLCARCTLSPVRLGPRAITRGDRWARNTFDGKPGAALTQALPCFGELRAAQHPVSPPQCLPRRWWSLWLRDAAASVPAPCEVLHAWVASGQRPCLRIQLVPPCKPPRTGCHNGADQC